MSSLTFKKHFDIVTKRSFCAQDLLGLPITENVNWPTALNSLVSLEEEEYWDKHITPYNYLSTVQMYTDERYSAFTDWLMSKKYVDKLTVMENLAQCCNPSFMDRYKTTYQIVKKAVLEESCRADNLEVVSAYVEKEKPTFDQLVEILMKCLNFKASSCVRAICELISETDHREAVFLPIWEDVTSYLDYSVYQKLEKFIKVSDDYSAVGKLEKFFVGTAEEVKRELLAQGKCADLSTVVSRIPHDEVFADLLVSHMEGADSTFSWDHGVAAHIFSSRRRTEDTEKIIKTLDSRKSIFDAPLDMSVISPESWQAILNTRELFSFHNAIMKRAEVPRSIVEPQNKELMKKVLVSICPHLDRNSLTYLFLALGSGTSKWGYQKDLFRRVKCNKKSIKLACRKGNVAVLILMLQKYKNLKFLIGSPVHPECKSIITIWGDLTTRQKKEYLSTDFGDQFYDTSLPSNNENCEVGTFPITNPIEFTSFMKKHELIEMQKEYLKN